MLESLTSDERTQWQLTETLPERFAKTTAAGSSPAPKSDVAAASSAATPGEQADAPASSAEPIPQKRTGHGGNADTRIQQLLDADARNRETIARLQGEMDALRRQPQTDAKAGSSPAAAETPKAEYERFLAMPDAPKEETFDSYAKFSAALGLFIADKRFEERSAQAQAAQAEHGRAQVFQQTVQGARDRVTTYAEAHPDFSEQVDPRLLEIKPLSLLGPTDRIGPHHVLTEQILRSEATAELLLHFSTPDGQKDWQRLCQLPPEDLLRAFGRIEAKYEAAPPPAADAPAPKTLSSAPPPPRQMGSRPQEPIDPSQAALKRRDFTAFAAAENAADLARLR